MDIRYRPGMSEGDGSTGVTAGSPPDAEVDASRVKGRQQPEGLSDLKRGIVGEHHAATADVDAGCMGGNLTNENLRGSAGKHCGIMVLRHPVPAVAKALRRLGQRHRLRQRLRRSPAMANR